MNLEKEMQNRNILNEFDLTGEVARTIQYLDLLHKIGYGRPIVSRPNDLERRHLIGYILPTTSQPDPDLPPQYIVILTANQKLGCRVLFVGHSCDENDREKQQIYTRNMVSPNPLELRMSGDVHEKETVDDLCLQLGCWVLLDSNRPQETESLKSHLRNAGDQIGAFLRNRVDCTKFINRLLDNRIATVGFDHRLGD